MTGPLFDADPPFVHELTIPGMVEAEPLTFTREEKAALDARLREIADARAQALAHAHEYIIH